MQLGTTHIGNNIPARGLQGEVELEQGLLSFRSALVTFE